MKIAVRLDDIAPNMDWEKFIRMRLLLKNYNIAPLIGVIPDNRDNKLTLFEQKTTDEYKQILLNAADDGWEIGLHGYRHVYQDRENNKSEFCGLDFATQNYMIKDGMEQIYQLCGVTPKAFFAPSNNHDDNTIAALKENGIFNISYGIASDIYEIDRMRYIPFALTLRRIEAYLSRRDKEIGVTTLVLHTNTMNEQLFQRCERLFIKMADSDTAISFRELYSRSPKPYNEKWHKNEVRMAKIDETFSKIKHWLK